MIGAKRIALLNSVRMTPPLPQVYEDAVLQDQPIAYWRLNEASGATLVDSSGNDNDASVVGAPTYEQLGLLRVSGSSLRFNGAEYINADALSTLLAGGSFSLEGIFQPDDVSANRILFSFNAFGGANVFHLKIDTGGTIAFFDVSEYHGNTTVAIDQSFHVVLTYDATTDTIDCYINGVADGNQFPLTTAAAITAGDRFTIGAEWDSGPSVGDYFIGLLDEIAVYDYVLSPQRVAAHYNARRSRPTYSEIVLADSPMSYWRLSETAGDVAADEAGFFDGTFMGGYTRNEPRLIFDDTPGGAAALNGTSGYLKSGTDYGAFNSFTQELWIRPDAVNDGRILAIKWGHVTGDPNTFYFRIQGGKLQLLCMQSNKTVITATGATTIVAGTTYHVAAQADEDAGLLRVYLNGVVDGQQAYNGTLDVAGTISNLAIGAKIVNGGPSDMTSSLYFDGWFDEPAFYNYAVPAARLLAHYEAGRGA